MPEAAGRPRVVIVGAGFGGLQAASALARAPVDVTIIDRYNYHCFQPLLYQVATAALSATDIAWPIRGILRGRDNIRVVMANVHGVDIHRRIVHADSVGIPYDFLVLATGAIHSYFGHDEWAKTAPGLKTIDDALLIRRQLLLAFERAELCEDERERRQLLTFVVVGGGPTGVEMAGAIAEVARHTLREEFRRIDTGAARVVLIEAGPRILPSFPERLSKYAERVLARMGVEVLTNSAVTECRPKEVVIGDHSVPAGTIIWAAGVRASPAAEWIKAERDRAGRVKVGPDLRVAAHPEIFAIGDTASVQSPEGKNLPGIAPVAKQMGNYVAKAIAAQISGSKPSKPFRYRHYGDLATIGRRAAVVRLPWFELTGFAGWLFWSVAHVYFLIGARNRLVVAFDWLWNYLTFQRGARVIIERAH